MKCFVSLCRNLVVSLIVLLGLSGCSSTDSGGSQGNTSVYYGAGVYDPWYYGGYYDDVDIIVTPPSGENPPPKPTHPIAMPPAPKPTPMPSIPRAPMPMPRVRVR